jgi:hypothetical protein
MHFIILERTFRWAAAFRRQMRMVTPMGPTPRGRESLAKQIYANGKTPLAKDSRPLGATILQEVRSVAQCQRALEASPHSVVAVEVLPQNLATVAKALTDWSRRFPHARFLALAARGLEPHELLLREAGAIHVSFSPRSLAPPLRLIRRHLARAPREEQTLEEAIWAALPWA